MLTRDNRPDNLHAGLPGNIAENVGQLQVHQLQGFLHLLNVTAAIAN